MTIAFWIILAFVAVYGACIGSFLNVVIYRLPEGLSIVHPPSSCPSCRHRLAWYDNIPVVAWLWLRARCRYCRAPISVQYPIIEAGCALLFAGLFFVYYGTALRTDVTALGGLANTWPVLIVHLVLLAGLLAATVVDFKLYIIPLQVPWFVTLAALVGLPLASLWLPVDLRYMPAFPRLFPVVDGALLGVAAGAAVGLSAAILLLELGLLPRSFDEDELAHDLPRPADAVPPPTREAEAALTAAASAGGDVEVPRSAIYESEAGAEPSPISGGGGGQGEGSSLPIHQDSQSPHPDPLPEREGGRALEPSPSGGGRGQGEGSSAEAPGFNSQVTSENPAAELATRNAQPATADETSSNTELATRDSELLPTGAGPSPPSGGPSPSEGGRGSEPGIPDPNSPEAWLAHPHPRREVLKECVFLALPAAGAIAGWLLWDRFAGSPTLPVWLHVLAGVVFGYFVGGGLIWFTRIAGTLAFGREAMGLGDVHLLAAIGAVLGAVDAALVFFIAPFFGLLYALIALALRSVARGRLRVIPYGPYLALAAVVVMVLKRPIYQFWAIW